jgi:hypothetical protein
MHIYIVHEVRWLYIPADVHAHAHVMATAASSARAIARSCAFEAVQPHARPYPSLKQVHIYLYTSVHTRARAHRRSRRAQRHAPHRRPGRARPAAVARRRAEKAAHTEAMSDTDAVFHAPMFALNAEVEDSTSKENACGPNHPRSTPTEGARMCRRGCVRAQSHTHTRAHTDAARVRVCAAGPHRRSARRGSQTRMDIDTCMHHVSIYHTRACSIGGWRYKESASPSHTCRVLLAHRQRPHAIPRVCENTHAHPFTHLVFTAIYAYIYIVHHVRWLYIPADVHAHAHVMATAASSARAIARSCAFEAVQPHARPYPSLKRVHMYPYVYIYA